MRIVSALFVLALLLPVPSLAQETAQPAPTSAESVTTQQTDNAVDVTEHATSATEEHHKAASPVPQFDPASFAGQLFWLAISFVLLYVLMSRVALPRIGKAVESRAHHIAADLQQAQASRHATQDALTGYEAKLVLARHEAQTIVAQAQATAAQSQTLALMTQGAKITADLQAAEARINAAKNQALADIAPAAARAASQVITKLTGVNVDHTKLDAAVSTALNDIKGKAA